MNLVSMNVNLTVPRKHPPLQLFFLDAFQGALLLDCFHYFAFAKYSTERLQDQRQRSGPDSFVARFIRKNPFPLGYKAVQSSQHPETFIAKALKAAGGIRFADKIASELSENFSLLEASEWAPTLEQCNRLTQLVSREVEIEVADHVQKRFLGFGPKQSRNLMQSLGLTRYEIPIDSRLTDWLNEFGFPMRLSATALADDNYYRFVSDGIQALCERSGVLPCIFDAAVFASSDSVDWTDKNVIF